MRVDHLSASTTHGLKTLCFEWSAPKQPPQPRQPHQLRTRHGSPASRCASVRAGVRQQRDRVEGATPVCPPPLYARPAVGQEHPLELAPRLHVAGLPPLELASLVEHGGHTRPRRARVRWPPKPLVALLLQRARMLTGGLGRLAIFWVVFWGMFVQGLWFGVWFEITGGILGGMLR